MLQDGLSTNSDTNVNSNERTTTKTGERTTTKAMTNKDQANKLRSIQDKLFALIGLKAAIDKLKSLKYEVVVQPNGGCTQFTIDFKVLYDLDTGLIGGKDIMAVISELEKQINELEGKK